MKLNKLLFFFLVFLTSLAFPKLALAGYKTQTIIPSSYENYGTAQDMVMLPNGKIWYADSLNQRLVKIDPSTGEILRTIGRSGSDEGEFDHEIVSVTVDDSGNLYALDSCHVFKFDSNGGFIKSFGSCGDTADTGEMSIAKSIKYDSYSDTLYVSDSVHDRVVVFSTDGDYLDHISGSELGLFDDPTGITTDSDGKLYVVDSANSRVQVLDSDWSGIFTIGSADPGVDQLDAAKDVEVLSNGDIIVTSQNAPKILKFDSNGDFILSWGTNGTGESEFTGPRYMTQGLDGSIWVSDPGQNKIQNFSNTGTFVKTIGNNFNSAGKFVTPSSVDFDNSGNMYVLDSTHRVQKFDSNGTYVSTVIAAAEGHIGDSSYHIAISPVTQNIFVSMSGTVAVYNISGTFLNYLGNETGSGGTDPGEFDQARGMAFDSSGNIYVADLSNNRVQKFDPTHVSDADFYTTYSGGYLLQFGSAFADPAIAEDGKFNHPNYIFIDSSNNVYVSDENNDVVLRVQKFNTSGVFQSITLQKFGTDSDEYYIMSGFYIDGDGNRYVTDHYYNRIQIYNSSNTLIETIGSGGGGDEQFSEPSYGKEIGRAHV